MRDLMTADASRDDGVTARRLQDEIVTLEKRIAQIGPDGDCGYEKAMIRFFRDQIEQRRRWLNRLPRYPADTEPA